MGMDCVPRRGHASVHYNWSGWRALEEFLDWSGVDVELAGSNDGEYIRAEDCRAIAKAIDRNPTRYNALYGGTLKEHGGYGDNPATEHANAWRDSGGMRQW